MKICMIGTGYVGLVSGTCFADIGHTVHCVDNNKFKIEKLISGESPIYEPGLDELIKENSRARRLFFTSSLSEGVNKSDIIFICVGTPRKSNSSSVDLTFVLKAAKQIAKTAKSKNNKKLPGRPFFVGSKLELFSSLICHAFSLDQVCGSNTVKRG